MSLIGEERKEFIMNLLYAQGKVHTLDLAEKLEVSSETVRRYLETLEAENKLKRVYGGAVQLEFGREEPSYGSRAVIRLEEKKRIGRAAASLVQDKEVIILDDGTTALQMVEFLTLKRGLTVLTGSIPIMTRLLDYKSKNQFDGEIIFIGGRVNAMHSRASGALSQRFMESMQADKAFIVADGIHPDKGVTSYDDERGLLARTFMKQSNQSVILCDHSKLGAGHFFKIGGFEEFDVVVSDAPYPDAWGEAVERSGAQWHVANGEGSAHGAE